MYPDNRIQRTYFGRLSFSSYLKLALFVGVTSGIVYMAVYAVASVLRLATGHESPAGHAALPTLKMMVFTPIESCAGSLLSALVGYPLYVWICSRRGGHVISGFMRQTGGPPDDGGYGT